MVLPGVRAAVLEDSAPGFASGAAGAEGGATVTNGQAHSQAKKAQRAETKGEAGWYVRNVFTGIAVAGPFADPEPARAMALELAPPTMRAEWFEGDA
jgi:hypothetical protein